MAQKILITSALPYANGPLHFGHIAGAYLPGDCYARFQRMRGQDVHYVCGSDEHGVAITLSAEMAGRSPQEHVDIFHEMNKKFFEQLNFSFDHYSRTTWEGHAEASYEYFNDLLEQGYIEKQECEQLYSEADQKFLADRYVIGTCPQCGFERARGDECQKCGASYEATDLKKPRSKLTNSPLELKKTTHWFLMLDHFRDELMDWLEKKEWKSNVTNFVKKYIEGLRPRAITRDSNWGFPVPLKDAEGKVLYVWFDAPIGYISASKEWAQLKGKPDEWKEYWCDSETKLVQFIGKDNIPFHAVIFPAMTMGQKQPYKLVDELPANEFYNLEGRQFSKSEGWYIDLKGFFEKYSADQIRYAIAANAPESADSEFTWKGFQSACNGDLLGKYGNLANRTLVFAKRSCESQVPEVTLEEIDQQFIRDMNLVIGNIIEAYETFKLRKASQLLMELASLGNGYFDKKEPWKAAKDPERQKEMETTIACCCYCLKAMAVVSSPIIPTAAANLWKMLGYESELEEQSWDEAIQEFVPAGQQLPEPAVLFRKIEDKEIEAELKALKEMAAKAEAEKTASFEPLKDPIEIEDFRRLDLRVGVVKSATKVPKSKRLLKLDVDLGFESRTIVSGIAGHYDAASVIGKKVIVVANLKSATLMGIESQGMILAGNFADTLKLASIDELPAGSVVS